MSSSTGKSAEAIRPPPAGPDRPRLVVIGTSLGGLHALRQILGSLPRQFRLPVAAVLHRGPDEPGSLAEHLQKFTCLRVSEPEDKEAMHAGQVYLAPADYHLLVDRGGFALSKEDPVHHARPSIDVLFGSAAAALGEAVVGVVLSGSNEDGAWGAAEIKRRGGTVIVEDPTSAHSPTMPRAAASLGSPDRVLALAEIPGCLVRLAAGGRP